ncbi:hypothetical protein RYZ26_18340 [Terasakiella sp. A23]|uniref:hypothetical protein n=1 Tax=Terasakiella sp. FCG-A23 TaxID=3080561 RepID=UPI002955421F|nr:hypothetical protein [Terasakiella sp. A23]MDV7341570.1 hypothetical protein [Terasakiella sp. A23]
MHYENHVENIARKYPHCFCLESKLISTFERLDNTTVQHLITDGIGLTATRETLREERQLFGSYQIFIHTKSKEDMDSLMALI